MSRPELDLIAGGAAAAALEAGRLLMGYFNRAGELKSEKKGPFDLTTEADLAAEELLHERLSSLLPGAGFVGEEGGGRSEGELTWLVDPLDGTKNFLRGLPLFCVSIGLMHNRKGLVGVVHDPVLHRTYSAYREGGCTLDGQELSCSGVPRLEEAFLATGFPHRTRDETDDYIKTFRALFPRALGIRRTGSAALDLACVAAGVYDGFWEFRLNPWDIAAGVVLVQEAGGVVTDFGGGNALLGGGDVVAGSRAVHGEMLGLIRGAIAQP